MRARGCDPPAPLDCSYGSTERPHYLWRAVDHEGEVLEVFATKRRDRKAALSFIKRAMKRYARPKVIMMDRLKSYRAAMSTIGNDPVSRRGAGSTTGPKTHISPSGDENEQWRNSGVRNRFRNSLRSTPRSTTTSTTNAISTAATFSNKPEPPPGRVA